MRCLQSGSRGLPLQRMSNYISLSPENFLSTSRRLRRVDVLHRCNCHNLMWPMGEKLHEGMAGGVAINLQWRTIFWPGQRAQIILTCEWETPHYQGIPRESTLILSSPKLPSTDPPQWLWSGHFSHGEAIAVIQFFRNLFVKQALQTRFKGELRQWIGYF